MKKTLFTNKIIMEELEKMLNDWEIFIKKYNTWQIWLEYKWITYFWKTLDICLSRVNENFNFNN